jgi:hypothetical protein
VPPPAPSAGASAISELSQAVEELGRTVKDKIGPSLADTTIKLTALGVVLSKLGAVEGVLKPLVRNVSETFRRLADVEAWLKPFTLKLGDAFGKSAPAWAQSAAQAFDRLGSQVADLLKPVTVRIAGAVKWLASAASAVAAVSAAAPVAATAVAALASVMSGLVAKANPALVELFTFAMNDLQAVIGQGLAPAFRILSDLVRAFADTLATFMPQLGAAVGTILKPLADTLKILFEVFGNVAQVVAKVLTAVAPAFAALGEAFNAVLRAILPVVNLIVDVFGSILVGVMKAFAAVVETVVPPIVAFIQVIGDMVKWFVGKVRELLEFLGLLDPETPGTEKGKSFGASARSASTSSVESVLQKARESAFTLGNAAAEDPKLAVGKSIDAKVAEIKRAIEELPERFAAALARHLDKPVEAYAEFVDRATGTTAATDTLRPIDPDAFKRAEDFARRLGGGPGAVPAGGP